MKPVFYLLLKEWKLEKKQAASWQGLVLYILGSVFCIYLSIRNFDDRLWNALFWILTLFTCMQSVLKIFYQENRNRHLFYFQLFTPQQYIIAKICYNAFLNLMLCMVLAITLMILAPVNFYQVSIWLVSTTLGVITLSNTLTAISSIAVKSSNNTTLMAILSFPIVIPMLLVIIRLTLASFTDIEWQNLIGNFLALFFISVMIVALALLLFPYLWRD